MPNFIVKSTVVFCLSILIAYVGKFPLFNQLNSCFTAVPDNTTRKLQIASAWDSLLGQPSAYDPDFQWIAVGINADVDIIVDGIELLQAIGISGHKNITAQDHATIKSVRELSEIFTNFHKKGAGGERFMDNKNVFNAIALKAKSLKSAQIDVGGNAALIAQKLAVVGKGRLKVMYGSEVGPTLKPLLHPSIICPSMTSSDEFHLILEYAKRSMWNGNQAPIASRFIFSNDVTNGKVTSFETFLKNTKEFQPDIIVISGLHLLEGQSKDFWHQRLDEISTGLSQINKNTPIHLELASMFNEEFVKMLSTKTFPLVDSLGFNEQEMWIICLSGNGPACTEKESLNGPPTISKTNDIVAWILNTFGKNSRLSRIHFHTLTHHTVALKVDSRWSNGRESVAAGARIASTQACGVEQIHPAKSDLIIPVHIAMTNGYLKLPKNIAYHEFNPLKPVFTLYTNFIHFFSTPVIICKEPVKTVGLGDAITALGLFYSTYT